MLVWNDLHRMPPRELQRFYYASFSAGTDEKKLIDILCYRSNAQRQELKIKYKSFYGQVSMLSVVRYHC